MMGQVFAPRLFLIDSYGFIFRAYHARARTGAPPMRTGTGVSTEAIFIFNNMLRKLAKHVQPGPHGRGFRKRRQTHLARAGLRRIQSQPHRNAAAISAEQIPYIRRLLEAMRIPILQFPGFEADDVIGTLSCRAAEAGYEVVIVSSDKDMLQLVNDRVSMLNPAKDDTWYDPPR